MRRNDDNLALGLLTVIDLNPVEADGEEQDPGQEEMGDATLVLHAGQGWS
eukprot:CAMPEP_0182507188 /NCGR_PEP_ID=MMETSP1321-20130603/22646_1 /TAXON_ID=91990 /ORGANISM="Bolidomonas sp., Strain RCC1657" /LENGTH=49 /DNA_ID= /DNA_START= /DNA_END= /DNA_ORIENTATION=